MAQTVWQLVVYAKGIMKWRSTYNLKIDTISTYDSSKHGGLAGSMTSPPFPPPPTSPTPTPN